MIELDDGLFFDEHHGTVVKAVSEDQCALFPRGTSPVDGGFLIERPAADVAEEIAAALDDES